MEKKDKPRLQISQADVWMQCSGSVPRGAAGTARGGNAGAVPGETADGIRAHALAAAMLRRLSGEIDVEEFKRQRDEIGADKEMFRAAETYARAVQREWKSQGHDAVLHIEAEVAPYPEFTGRADAVICARQQITVIDFKYGANDGGGEDWTQLKLYAAGAAVKYGYVRGDATVVMRYIYPRRAAQQAEQTATLKEIQDWLDKAIWPRAQEIIRGEIEYKPGPHCRRCTLARRGGCPRFRSALDRIARRCGENAGQMSDADLADIVAAIAWISPWLKDFTGEAIRRMQTGRRLRGLSLTAGRATRRITNQQEAIRRMTAAGYRPEDICKAKGLGDLQALMGDDFERLLGDLIDKTTPADRVTVTRWEEVLL